jgi:DNA (cytosine-5)-methyltransferase 1
MKTLSLFTGAGGLDLGLERAGFEVSACIEIESNARRTLRANRPSWNVLEQGDIFSYSPDELLSTIGIRPKELALISGGPPCQPFSKSGQWANSGSRRLQDPRSKTLVAYLNILEKALPEVFLLENVKGMHREGSSEPIELFHSTIKRINKKNRTKYDLQVFTLNAVDYGVPQHRERIFLIAHRGGKKFEAPKTTHASPEKIDKSLQSWRTAWDAIGHLNDVINLDPELQIGGKWGALVPSVPEGKNYLWHTPKGNGQPLFGWRTKYWTFLLKLAKNRPSWTLQASPGTATGPFHWNNRRLSIEELALLQTFPEDYQFYGSYWAARKQIGNAVPSAMAELIGLEIRRQFFGERVRRELSLIPEARTDCPAKTRVRPVPKQFLSLKRNHAPHPGTGLGPQPRSP